MSKKPDKPEAILLEKEAEVQMHDDLADPATRQSAMSYVENAENNDTPLKGISLDVTFSPTDFPTDPDWGMVKENMSGGGSEYRKDARRLSFARGLEAMKKSGLPIDFCLAVAAAVSSVAEKGPYVMYLRGVGIDRATGNVRATYSNSPHESAWNNPYEKNFTPDEILSFHIPTATEFHSPQVYAEAMRTNPHETLWRMTTASPQSKVEMASWATDNCGFFPMKHGNFALHSEQGVLAQFPLDRLNLSEAERELVNERKKIKAMSDEMMKAHLLVAKAQYALGCERKQRSWVPRLAFDALDLAREAAGKITYRQLRERTRGAQSYGAVSVALMEVSEEIESAILERRKKGEEMEAVPPELEAKLEDAVAKYSTVKANSQSILEQAEKQGLVQE